MATSKLALLESRLSAVEAELTQLKQQQAKQEPQNGRPGVEGSDKSYGAFVAGSDYDKTLEAAQKQSAALPWWEKIAGTFADSKAHEEAMKLGRKYRQAQRPKIRKKKGS